MTHQHIADRFAGTLIGSAVGDSLGAGYEFGPSLSPDTPVEMRGQGAFAPGEWTDDTAQMIAIAQALAAGHDLLKDEGQEAVAANLLDWYYSPAREKDIGIHTSAVMTQVATVTGPGLADRFREVAKAKEQARPNSSGGNGALMRTAPIALAYIDDPKALVEAARQTALLTHDDDASADACAVWCLAIREAALTGTITSIDELAAAIRQSLTDHMPDEAPRWISILDEAQGTNPRDYRSGNGYSVTALQAAWAAITSTPIPKISGQHFAYAIAEAVRGGGDTDTVACIAGGLLGAMWGASAIPADWQRRIFGWPSMTDRDLVALAGALASKDVDQTAWPHADHMSYAGWAGTDAVALHPHDDGVVLGGVDVAYGIVESPIRIDAVVSLCRIGETDLDHLGLPPTSTIEVRLIDQVAANPHAELTLRDAAAAVAQLRSEGKNVLLHCVAAQSRTPSVAALYARDHLGISPQQALDEVIAVLPAADPNPEFRSIVLSA